ncbi:hypothetical protein F5J12DRAFT_785010 [Pisolithus orientalis]|uniref:uncharacterized protein n=1 Tax=Pisolithus orientalis TaxID=936130 RepID=UPI002224779E|nr:uncharacterized protein F5J12DRAFT_785010 [Pisolithus orientalis]KAI5997778.1 hypothetical protein F5J12DRAFT_785010 [Pisolithus orientalis]
MTCIALFQYCLFLWSWSVKSSAMTMSAELVTISCRRATEGVVAAVWDASACWDIFVEVGYWCESGAVKSLNIMEQKSVRWRLGSPDTQFISPHNKPWVLPGTDNTDMVVDEPQFLPFGVAMNATAWGHQLGLPSSSMLLNACPSQPLLSMLAPSWDSPPLSLEVQPSAADQQWEAWQASHSMPSLAAIAPSWDLPTSSPAVSPPPRSLPASTQIPQTAPSPLDHAYMDEQLDGVAASEPQPIPATSQQPSPQPMATNATAVLSVLACFLALQRFASDLVYKEGIHDEGPITTSVEKAQWLVVLLMGPADEHLPHLNTTTDGQIIVAYNHYSNILVESSIWFHLLLARRAQLARTQQYIQDLMTSDWDGKDELELDEDLL